MRALSDRSEEHTSELQSPDHIVCRLLLEKKKYSRPLLVYWLYLLSDRRASVRLVHFFFHDTPLTEIYTLSLHDALPISLNSGGETEEFFSTERKRVFRESVELKLKRYIVDLNARAFR